MKLFALLALVLVFSPSAFAGSSSKKSCSWAAYYVGNGGAIEDWGYMDLTGNAANFSDYAGSFTTPKLLQSSTLAFTASVDDLDNGDGSQTFALTLSNTLGVSPGLYAYGKATTPSSDSVDPGCLHAYVRLSAYGAEATATAYSNHLSVEDWVKKGPYPSGNSFLAYVTVSCDSLPQAN